MKLALIAPYDLLDYSRRQDYHLFLPPQMLDSKYADYASSAHGYKILDNGAAEGTVPDMEALIALAYEYGMHEIVIPDVIGSAQDTIDMYKSNMTKLDERFAYMGVVQGNNLGEILACSEAYANDRYVRTIGIPRCLIDTFDDIHARLRIYSRLFLLYGDRFDYHFLGANFRWPDEASKMPSRARGIDTSMPFVAAYNRWSLMDRAMPSDLKRPPDYFARNWTDTSYVSTNVGIMKAWIK